MEKCEFLTYFEALIPAKKNNKSKPLTSSFHSYFLHMAHLGDVFKFQIKTGFKGEKEGGVKE